MLCKKCYVYILWYIRKSWKDYYTCDLYLSNNLVSYALIQEQFNKVIIKSMKFIAKKNYSVKSKLTCQGSLLYEDDWNLTL